MAEHSTGVKDEHYNLVSVLYHALTAADTYDEYIRDAEQAGDQELVEFFRTIQSQDRERAQRAEALLAARFPGHGG
jgi:rubrerythrin